MNTKLLAVFGPEIAGMITGSVLMASAATVPSEVDKYAIGGAFIGFAVGAAWPYSGLLGGIGLVGYGIGIIYKSISK